LSVDHGLRAESASEVAWVCRQARIMGFECEELSLEMGFGGTIKTSVQETARIKRYDILWQAAQKHHLDEIHLGHHANDQAETVLSRLQKNSGIAGLVGMWEKFYYDDICFTRPLLHLYRHDIESSMIDKEHIQDPSNFNTQFERVFLRQFLDKNPDVTQKLLVIACNSQKLMSSLLYERNIFLTQNAQFYAWGYAELSRLEFEKQHNMLQKEIIKFIIKYVSGNFYIPHFNFEDRKKITIANTEISFNKHKITVFREKRNLVDFDEKRFIKGNLHKHEYHEQIPHKAFISLPNTGFSYSPQGIRRFVNLYDYWLMKKIEMIL
jgi:tRNA(Ile)-lysidine synthase